MSLVNKIFREEEPPTNNHVLAALLRLWFLGETTRPQTIADVETMLTNDPALPYVTTAPEKDTLDEFKAHYDGLGSANAKQDYFSSLESSLILAEHGAGTYLTKAVFKTFSGLTTA